jgi:hypothetical protein
MEVSNTEQLINKIANKLSRKKFTNEERKTMAQELMHLAIIFTEMHERGMRISKTKNTK